MTYVALLRGINVGGNAKIDMARLKHLFITIGCTNVLTYINSGNVIFSNQRPAHELATVITAAITDEFRLVVPVVVRSQAAVRLLCQQIPANWTNDKLQKSDVYFLLPNTDGSKLFEELRIDSKVETVLLYDNVLLWNVSRELASKSQAPTLVKTKLYKSMTIRNVNTVCKLNSLMQSTSTPPSQKS